MEKYFKFMKICRMISLSIALFFIYKNCEYDFDLGFHFNLYLTPLTAFIVLWFLCDSLGIAWLEKKILKRLQKVKQQV